ncbi:MAG: YiiG family protein [Oxalobacter formigenes]|nr:YiiG family protein [Oxalobacter formigenes]
MMKPYSIFLSVVLVVCIGLVTACKRPESGAAKPAEPAQAVLPAAPALTEQAPTPEQLADKKRTVYANVCHTLVSGEAGLSGSYRELSKKVLKGKVSDDIAYPVVADLDGILETLRQNRAVPGEGMAEMDTAADQLVAAAEKIRVHEKELVPYFQDKIYRTDDMAKVKVFFADLEQDYTAALAALSALDAEVLKGHRAAAEKEKEAFKEAGDMVRYHTEEMLLLLEELLAIFDDPRVPFNRAEAFSRGNGLTVKLDQAIRAQRKAIEEAKSKGSAVSPYYDLIRNHAVGIIADYREVRDRRSEAAFNNMLKRYDKAAQDYNSAQIKAPVLTVS